MKRSVLLATALAGLGALPAAASDTMTDMGGMGDSIEDLLARGEQIYFEDGGCVNCHGEIGEGDAGPALNAKARTPRLADFCSAPWPDFAPPLTTDLLRHASESAHRSRANYI